MTDTSLPKYRRPPVVEVGISVFFKPLPGFKTAHFGRFWSLNNSYPITEDQFPILEGGIAGGLLPPLRRVFLLTQDSNYVIQLQPDFFAHNWRKILSEDEYPSFEKAKGLFLAEWESFISFVAENKVGEIQRSRYEVTYVNHLIEDQAGAFPLAIERYSPIITLRRATSEHFLPDAKAFSADLQFEIPESGGTLQVSLRQGARASDAREVMQMNVSARKDASPDGSDMSEWLEVAHEWIVRGFTDLTTAEAHKLWERTR